MAIRLTLKPAVSRKMRKLAENMLLRETGLTRQQYKRDKRKAVIDYVSDQMVEMFQQSRNQAGACHKHIEGGRT